MPNHEQIELDVEAWVGRMPSFDPDRGRQDFVAVEKCARDARGVRSDHILNQASQAVGNARKLTVKFLTLFLAPLTVLVDLLTVLVGLLAVLVDLLAILVGLLAVLVGLFAIHCSLLMHFQQLAIRPGVAGPHFGNVLTVSRNDAGGVSQHFANVLTVSRNDAGVASQHFGNVLMVGCQHHGGLLHELAQHLLQSVHAFKYCSHIGIVEAADQSIKPEGGRQDSRNSVLRAEGNRRANLERVNQPAKHTLYMKRVNLWQWVPSNKRVGGLLIPRVFFFVFFGCLVGLIALSRSNAATATGLMWQLNGGYRSAPLPVPREGRAGFTLLPGSNTGVVFTNRLSDSTIATNRLLAIGSGVALGDVDGDGLVDLYFCRLEGDNALYRNLGNWKFADITASSGVACSNQFSTGCTFADLDGDLDLDLLINSLGGGTRAFLNDGKGYFTEVAESGLVRNLGATSMALADVDGDGDLDLYVTNYRTDTFQDDPPGLRITSRRRPDGTEVIEPAGRFAGLLTAAGGVVVERGEMDVFYVSRGNGHFVPAPWNVGVFLDEEGKALSEPPRDWGLSVLFRDLNGDGLPDIYVCNDFPYWFDRIWLNVQGKRFQAAPKTAFRSTSLASMAVDVADINRDGFDDLFVADMLSPRREFRAWQRPDTLSEVLAGAKEDSQLRPEVGRNTLHLGRGDGTYAEIAQLAGVAATDWTWGSVFLDVDLDGWEDLLVATGYQHDVQDGDMALNLARQGARTTVATRLNNLGLSPHRRCPSMAFRNRHDLTFEDTSRAWGFDTVGVAQGLAMADLDNDGDLDVVINCLNGPARILRNESSSPRVAVRLKGRRGNTQGIGGRIRVTGGPVPQSQEMIAGGRYLSGDDPMRVFAAGDSAELEIEVRWRSGARSVVTNARPNFVYEIEEPAERGATNSPAPSVQPLFQDMTVSLNHSHTAVPFDDFARQPLLPRRLSTLGPGVAWVDLNGDGRDELIVGGGQGGGMAVFQNSGGGKFLLEPNATQLRGNSRSQTGLVAWRGAGDRIRILAGQSNWEQADTNTPLFRTTEFLEGKPGVEVPSAAKGVQSVGPLAMADIDGDGDLDLFVGGRAIPGRYPEAALSVMLQNDGDKFSSATRFEHLGLVSGAVLFDVDGDGDQDLALACEWGAIQIFRNDKGKFTQVTEAMKMSGYRGWWNGVAAGDFDGDGQMDLVASNWGQNWSPDPQPGADTPVRLYYGDFAEDGSVQTLLASMDPEVKKWLPWRERKAVIAAIPAVAKRAPNHHAYGPMGVEELLGAPAGPIRHLEVHTMASMVFLNRGAHFEGRRLPIEAQFSPAFGVVVADWDGNGTEDIFLAQNFFGVDGETSRQDGGVGLVLLGDGKGGFRALGPRESGISIYGEQRGAAAADFDGDGRIDLAVAQNNGPTRLFRGAGSTPGVRITVRGVQGNPGGIGARVRLKSRGVYGPVREVHSGGGYWSQDSATSVFATPVAPEAVELRMPGGELREWSWPAGAKNVEVSAAGVRAR